MVLTNVRWGCGGGGSLKLEQVPRLLGGLLEGISRPHSPRPTFAFLTSCRWDQWCWCGRTFEVCVSVKAFVWKCF